MTTINKKIAIIGAGIAGASCARWLHQAGFAVQVFEKARGVGGRMSTRRMDWTDAAGTVHQASFDHGAPGFKARSPEFSAFLVRAGRGSLLSPWQPSGALGERHDTLRVPAPDMPALCRALLTGLPVQTLCHVDALNREAGGWRLMAQGETIAQGFGAVVLAIPPAQAATLLQPLKADWAQEAQALPMLPQWTLMGLASTANADPEWQLAYPADGILAAMTRSHGKPGRQPIAGMTHWVLHATPEWSASHIEAPAATVQAALQQAMAKWLGRVPDWRHLAVHRWRYAQAPAGAKAVAGRCWWDADSGIGVCGDAWGGGDIEGAWHSARALAQRIDRHSPLPAGTLDPTPQSPTYAVPPDGGDLRRSPASLV